MKKILSPSLDILRGFAAISVVFYHVIEHYKWESFPVDGFLSWFRIGFFGVDIFFVLSGMLISLSAFFLIDFYEQKKEVSKFRFAFIKKRFLRIAPLHYLTCLIFLVFITPELLFEKFWMNFSTHLLFIHNFFPDFHGSINGVNWSLATEMQFYLLMMFFSPFIYRISWWKLSLIFVSISWSWRSLILIFTQDTSSTFSLFVLSTQLPGVLDEFLAGILIAKFVISDSYNVPIFRSKKIIFIIAAIFFYLTMTLFWKNSSYWNLPYMIIFFKTLVAFTLLFSVYLFFLLDWGIFLRFTAPLRYLGKISYGIYLWHLPVLISIKKISWLSPLNALFYILLLTMVLASLSWYFFERNFLSTVK